MSEWALKRFWTKAEVTEAEGGFAVTLDGRSVKTPAKQPLILPSRGFAERIAQEWQAQGDRIDPATMPFTRTANAAIDKLSLQHAEVADMLTEYGDSDLLCYRADGPAELVARQAAGWDPLLDWAAETLGARLAPREGIMHAPQDKAALDRLRAAVHAHTGFELAAFHDLVALTGSLILGFAVARGHLDAARAWDLSRIDEQWQIDQWGADEDEAEVIALKKAAFVHASQAFALARN